MVKSNAAVNTATVKAVNY